MEDLSDRKLTDLMDAIEEHGMKVVGKEFAADIEKQARREGAREERERWQQALNFLLGSVGEYGEGTPEGKAFRSAYVFVKRLAALQEADRG